MYIAGDSPFQVGIKDENKPIGVFLLGPTGTGSIVFVKNIIRNSFRAK
jgi:ATP-dependent Clp protease ATP-binding subunit ClpA